MVHTAAEHGDVAALSTPLCAGLSKEHQSAILYNTLNRRTQIINEPRLAAGKMRMHKVAKRHLV